MLRWVPQAMDPFSPLFNYVFGCWAFRSPNSFLNINMLKIIRSAGGDKKVFAGM